MKKHYIFLFGVFTTFLTSLVAPNATLMAQSMPPFLPYTHTPQYSWEGPYESYEYRNPNISSIYNMRFRLKKPNGWVATPSADKYPIIIFFHGSGEVGSGNYDIQDNSKQLVHGGQTHLNAVNNGTFPGFLLYPQMRRTGPNCGNINPNTGLPDYSSTYCPVNNWNQEWREAVRYVVDKLILDYKVDPNRIYVHGLSGGGEATWGFLLDYPEYVAAAHPMSAAGSQYYSNGQADNYKHIPLWSSQGALDGNPTPNEGNSHVSAIRNIGGSIRYSYYPNLGHGTWNDEYAKPDFFSWFLAKKKNQISVLYEQPLTCPGDPVNVTLGFSKTLNTANNPLRIINYEWASGTTSNVVASGATLNEITITTNGTYPPGTYYGRFQRVGGVWTDWSDPVLVDNSRGPSTSPSISANGKSTTLPSLDGGTEVLLTATADKAVYQWKRDAVNIVNATQSGYTASLPGAYTVISKDAAGSPYQFDQVPTQYRAPTQGCFSLPSNALPVTTSNGLDVPAPPGNFFVSSNSQNSVVVSWDDRSDNEDGFEIYRSLVSGSGYSLVTIVPASATPNPQTYTDNNLLPNTTYYYRMRSINYSGGSVYTAVASASTTLDNKPPSSPVLTIPVTLRSTVLLQWSGATDNVGITGYDIYQNGSIVASVNGATTYYEAKNLVALQVYNFYVKARDLAGNVSPQSNQLAATARNSGLIYKYYHHAGLSSTVEIPASATLNKIGLVSTFSTSPRTQTDNYAFVYEGFINLPTSGNYRFSLQTDEGSRMWVNNVLVVDNNGTHTCTKVNSALVNFSSGWYPVRVEYFENTNTECFTVRWTVPNQNENTIPSSAFTESVSNPPSVSNPSNLRSTLTAYNQVNLAWNDNSNNETGFEIYRLESATGTGTYQVVHVAAANTTTWNDTNVQPNVPRYYYRIRAISATNISSLINMNSPGYVATPAAPAPPAIPGSLTATPVSATQVNLSWGNVAGETGFELQKSSNNATGFVTIATRAADVTTYSDNDASGHSTYYYRVRSTGLGGLASNWSTVVSATTPNRLPVFTPISDQTLQQLSGTAQVINMSVSDPDNDPISFQFTGLPNTNVFTTNDFGQGALSFTNVAAGVYNIHVEATDGIATVVDDFVLTVSSNRAPIISALVIDGTAVTPTPVTTVQNQSMEAGREFRMVFTINDPDNNNQLTTTLTPIISLPPSLTFANNPAPAWTGNAGSAKTYTVVFKPTVSQTGFYENIAIQFRDNQGGVNLQTFSLIVNPVDPDFSISINFSEGTSMFEALPWNNTGPPSTYAAPMINLKDDQSKIVKYVKFATQNSSGWSGGGAAGNTALTLPADPNAVLTKNVRESYFRANSFLSSGISMKFWGLNPSLKYKVKVYAASSEAAAKNQLFTITSGSATQSITFNVSNNTNNAPITPLLSPNATGEIIVNVKAGVPFPGGYMYMNAIVLEAVYIENAPPPAPSEVTLEAPSNNRVNVGWQDNSFNETNFNIYRSTTLAGPYVQIGTVGNNVRTYSDLTASGRTTYFYKISAQNGFGESALSSHGLITTPNGVPVLTNPGTIVVAAGQIVQTNILAVDPEGDPMTFTVLGLPAFATLVDNGNGTGFIRFAPSITDVGPYQLNLNVVDNYSASAEATFPLVISDPAVAETVFINFTASTSSNAPAPWSNISSAGTFPTQLTNSVGQVGGASGTLSINRSSGTNWGTSLDNLGVNTGSNSGLYPDKVIQSGWVTSRTDNNSTITLSGLDNTKLYNLSILGSRDEFWFANTIYRVTTGTPNSSDRILNTRKNRDGIARFVGIAPNGSGVIAISVKKDPTQESVASGSYVNIFHRDGVINAMVVESYTNSTLRAPTNFKATATSKSSIRLTWFDNSTSPTAAHNTNETGFQIERAEDPAGPFTLIATAAANAELYDNISLPQNKAYVYRIRAIRTTNGTQSPWSAVAMASTFNQIVLVNINSTVGDGHVQAGSPWNNLNEITANIQGQEGFIWENFMSDTQAPTPTDLRIMYFGGGGARADRGYYNASGAVYPNAVHLSAYLFLPGDPLSEWKLEDLDPNAAYDLVFFSSEWEFGRRENPGGKIITDFIVGPEKKSLFNNKNNSERVFFNSIKPAADSTIYFQLGAAVTTETPFYNGNWNAFEIRSYTPINAAFDKEAPTAPQNLVASNIASDSLRLTWSTSIDNVGVTGYQVFRGSDLVATVAGTSTRITGLQPSTTYTFSVRARDAKGNLSAFSNAIQATTLNASGSVNYYPKPTGDLTVTTNWGTALDGSGTSPSTFAANNQHFIVNRTASINSDLNVTGSNTKIIINDGVTVTVNNIITGLVDVNANATLIVNADVSPELGTLAPTSTITFNGESNSIPGASYGNLVLDGTTSTKTFSTGTYVVNGNMTLADDITVDGSVGNGTVVNISGSLVIQGAVTPPSDNQLLTLNFISGQAQNIVMNAQEDLRLFQLRVSNNSTVAMMGGTTGKSVTVGTSGGGGLTIEEGSTLNLGNNSLVVMGAGSINSGDELGQFSVSKANITINSTGAQISNLYFKAASDTLNSIHLGANIAGQVNIASKVFVQEVVDVTSGRLNSSGNIALVSDINSTAIVSKIGSSGTILGNVQFQRYLNPKRVYRYMGAPVYGTRISDWQTHMVITGQFTGGTGVNPSLFFYDEPNGGWLDYPGEGGSNTATFDMGRGYSIFQYNGTTPSKLLITGPLQQGNFDYPNLAPGSADPAEGWSLLSNVYAAPIEWDNGTGWEFNEVDGTVWIRDNLPGGQGGFKQYNSVSGGDPDFNGIIAQGQAFWVKSNGSNPSVRITEDAKVSVPNAGFFRESPSVNQLTITVKNSTYIDRTFLHFSESSFDEIEGTLDAIKRDNTYFNLSTQVENVDMAINSMTLNFCEKSIPLNLRNITAGHYSLDFSKLETFNFDVEAKLIDRFTDTSITLSEGSVYQFDVTSDPSSFGLHRFELTLKKPEIDQSIQFSNALERACETTEGVAISLANSQRGVTYSFYKDGALLGNVQGNGGAIEALINPSQLTYGNNNIQMNAEFTGCDVVPLSSSTTINYKQVFEPIVSQASVCEGESAQVTVSGAPTGSVYRWYEAEDSSSPILISEQGNFSTPVLTKSKSYFVSTMHDECESSRSEVLVQVDHLDKPTIEVDGELLLSSSLEGNQWLLNGELIEGATDVTYIPEQSGDYSIMVTSGACTQISEAIIFSITGAESATDMQVNLYPNPVKTRLRITLPNKLKDVKDVSILVYNSQGQVAGTYSKQVKNRSVEVDVQDLNSGLYTLFLKADGTNIQKRFVKESN